ncbi:Lipid-A-disaccharide synthase [Rubellimicrobium mesophilum DSM 19309]|uniref:Lipid-A-disaccharide synthase n=1 Tax=Rubellimicrobium mesophilum DSM 19309 TaxID=442562 RepID=A0A017HM92_9RHOB|nr:lipid-A-disaccharide synthase N-terminal domain-containing protein [Rubellimicrobium mesophilum]EYD75288.1 Lipid-A-disaccharide synthase [Rubellimicrobium mesophilum DSM 19309]
MHPILTFFHVDSTAELVWVGIGFLAQVLFGSRFIVQWFHSEKAGESVIPIAFWWLSLTGGALMFAYAIYRWDPVFMLGQGLGLFVYVRNLMLIRRSSNREVTG